MARAYVIEPYSFGAESNERQLDRDAENVRHNATLETEMIQRQLDRDSAQKLAQSSLNTQEPTSAKELLTLMVTSQDLPID
jgi:hypothetical protein